MLRWQFATDIFDFYEVLLRYSIALCMFGEALPVRSGQVSFQFEHVLDGKNRKFRAFRWPWLFHRLETKLMIHDIARLAACHPHHVASEFFVRNDTVRRALNRSELEALVTVIELESSPGTRPGYFWGVNRPKALGRHSGATLGAYAMWLRKTYTADLKVRIEP